MGRATLDELTPWLFSRVTGGIRWGLERTEELLAGVDDPHRRFSSIHIAGTNGKGSVAAFCESILRSEGSARVGLYTSPHLVAFPERIRIDGRPVGEDVLLDAAERLRPAIERTGASFFEATTAIAFHVFAIKILKIYTSPDSEACFGLRKACVGHKQQPCKQNEHSVFHFCVFW